jgi:hypothetical protein
MESLLYWPLESFIGDMLGELIGEVFWGLLSAVFHLF